MVLFLFTISFLLLAFTEGKGFSAGRGGGGGFKGGSKGAGTFGGSSSYSRSNNYGSGMGKVRSGSSFKSKAMTFGIGAAGGIAAYSLMRSMSGSHQYRPGHYEQGYGGGDTCINNEDINGTVFGRFRCPLNGFPYDAKHCCGEYGHQFCCIREKPSGFYRGATHYGWIVIVVICLLIVALLWVRYRRQQRREVIMVPTEVPYSEQQGPPFYQPAPPPMGYPPPPSGYPPQQMNYPAPPAGNPYAPGPQNYNGNFNPYAQQTEKPYPTQNPYNPY